MTVRVLVASLRQLRPKQWAKNVFVLAAAVFARRYTDPQSIALTLQAFFAFSFVSSAGYVLNDWLDREADRRHPRKQHRPIASGALPGAAAAVLGVGSAAAGFGLAWSVATTTDSALFPLVLAAYLATTLSYSLYFKHVVILDVMVLALCYVWRVVGGAVAIAVTVSPWLFLCTAFISLFIGFNKRRAELSSLGANAGTRAALGSYSQAMILEYQAIVTANTVLSYMLYAVLGPTPWMVLTVPFVLYGLFRYIYLVDQAGAGAAPDEDLLRDRPILATVVLYALVAIAVLQLAPHAA